MKSPNILYGKFNKNYLIEFVKENGNSCVMWIDLSKDKKDSDKSHSRRSDIISDNDNPMAKIEDPNTTYIIHKEAYVKTPVDANDDTANKTIIKDTTPLNDAVSQKSSCDLEESVKRDQENQVNNSNGDSNNNLKLTSTHRRRSSSIFMETLRKLVCLHER